MNGRFVITGIHQACSSVNTSVTWTVRDDVLYVAVVNYEEKPVAGIILRRLRTDTCCVVGEIHAERGRDAPTDDRGRESCGVVLQRLT